MKSLRSILDSLESMAARSRHVGALATLLVAASSTWAAPQTFEAAKLVVPAEEVYAFDSLGKSVSVTETSAWLGEPQADHVSANEGSVRGFQRTSRGWMLTDTHSAVEPLKAAHYGRSLSFTDDVGFVGSPDDNEVSRWVGAIFLFEQTGDQWDQIAKILPPDTTHQFGKHLALAGDQLLVGATGDEEAGKNSGAAYVYRRDPQGDWIFRDKLLPSHTSHWAWASWSLDFDGSTAILGTRSEQAFVFERTASGWAQTAVLEDPTPQFGDEFGLEVAVEGDVIAVGEPVPVGHDVFRFGSVFVYERAGSPPGNWVLAQELQASNKSKNPDGGDEFGMAVDLHEGRLLVGARHGKVGNEVRGTAYLFEPGELGWEETMMLAPSEKFDSDSFFGEAVSLSASFALVGARFAEGSRPGLKSGAGYVFELPLGDPTCPGEPNSAGQSATIQAKGSLSAAAGSLDLSAAKLPANRLGLFLLAEDGGFVQNPGGSQGNLCLGGTTARLQDSLQSSGSSGELQHTLDFDDLPLPPPAEILPGETWHFQAWYRDVNPNPTSNFTGALAITFR